MAFDIDGARKEGYSDAEIAEHLAKGRKFDLEGARKEGHSDADIIAHLSKAAAPTAPKTREQARGEKIIGAVRAAKDYNPVSAIGETALSLGTGMVATPLSGIAGMISAAFGGADKGANTVRSVQDALTYQPRTRGAQTLTEGITYPLRKLDEATHAAGGAMTDVAGPEMGAAAKVGLDAIPMAIAGGVARVGAGRTATQPQPRAIAPPAAPSLPAEAAARVQMGRDLAVPVEYTRSQATRDAPAMRREANLAETPQGAPIRERLTGQQQAIMENLDVLKGAAGAKAKTTEQVGAKVAGEKGALTLAERKSDLNVDRLYQEARKKGEMGQAIDLKPILDAVAENPNASALLNQQLKAMNLIKEDGTGTATLNQLERARKRAVLVARTASDGTMRFDAGELIKAIDKGTPEGVGGEAYKAARAARKEHAMKFEEPKAVSQLIENRTATDRKVALEDVWDKTVRHGSIADMELVRNQLLKSTDRQTRDAGRKAWREIVGETASHFRAAAEKGPDSLKKAVDDIGQRKLDLLFGPSSAQKVRNIVQVAQDTGKLERTRVGSTTVPNALSVQMDALFKVLDKVVSHVPFVSDTARGAVVATKKLAQTGREAKFIQEALRDPLPKPGTANLPRRNRPASRLSPAIPLSEVGQQPPQ